MDQTELDKMRENPTNWKWGIFYYNPKDPRSFLPKRIKWMGFTVNFAKPLSYVFLILLFVAIVALKNYL